MLDETKLVLWTQGLFLQPQHFQASDLAADARTRSLRLASDPWPWGFFDLQISPGGLQNNQIEITRLHAVFQDGTEVAVPGNAVVAPRSFAAAWTQPDHPFKAYLALRRHDPNVGNVTSCEENDPDPGSKTRYRSSYTPGTLADAHGDGPAEGIRTLEYSLAICWETELDSMADCDFLPLARLVRVGEHVTPDGGFVPPSLTLGAFDPLRRIVREARDQLLGRAANLEEYKPAEGRTDQWLGDPKAFGMLLTLLLINRNIPALDFAAETEGVRPWQAHLFLRQVVAELSSLVTGINAGGETERGEKLLPVYDHADPWPCFSAARNLISSLLSRVASGPEYLIRMEPEDGMLTARPPEGFFGENLRHYLLLRGGGKTEQIRVEAARYGKLCPMQSLREIIGQALPGIPLRELEQPPVGLPRRSDTIFFEIAGDSPLWRDLLRGSDKGIAFVWDGGGADVVAHLAAMRAY